jgi:hypothetical protein
VPQSLVPQGVSEDRTVGGSDLRLLARRVDVLGKAYTIQVAVPMHELREGLSGYAWALMCPATYPSRDHKSRILRRKLRQTW